VSWVWILVSAIWLAPASIALGLLGGSMVSKQFRAWLQGHLIG